MSSPPPAPPSRPARLASRFGDNWTAVTIGQSVASVWRIGGPDEALFLKTVPLGGPDDLADEVARLAWLDRSGVAAPKVRDFFTEAKRQWLLMTAIPGADLTHLVHQPDVLCGVLAKALRELHALDPATCPFVHALPGRLDAAARNVACGWVDESDFDTERAGWRAGDVLAWARDHQPRDQDLVVTHGDASLPNFIACDGQVSGLIDCSRLGIADRWQDLALACRSVAFNCGDHYLEPFLARYGAAWNGEKYRFFCALDDLF